MYRTFLVLFFMKTCTTLVVQLEINNRQQPWWPWWNACSIAHYWDNLQNFTFYLSHLENGDTTSSLFYRVFESTLFFFFKSPIQKVNLIPIMYYLLPSSLYKVEQKWKTLAKQFQGHSACL